MNLMRDGLIQVPDCPPVACIAVNGEVLQITVRHAAAADLFWQQRHRLTAVFRCSGLRLTVLKPPNTDGLAIDLEWQRPSDLDPSLSCE
jgi:hypothetical protein